MESPATCNGRENVVASVSTQQALAVRYLRNSMAVSYASGGLSVFHLGGLPGAGKTSTVKKLIAELAEANLIDVKGDVLLCAKSNSAKTSLLSACQDGVPVATVNSGFSIPVVHGEVSQERLDYCAGQLTRKILECGLGNLQFLVVDEYTLTSAREIIYLDSILKMVKFRPDIPFGGVFVLFLGDNRQNSAVVEDSERIQEADDVENDTIHTDVLIEILKRLVSKKHWGDAESLKTTLAGRLNGLVEKQAAAASKNIALGRGSEKFDSEEDALMHLIGDSDKKESSFSSRCGNPAPRNTMDVLRAAPLSAIAEEGLKSEIEHLTWLMDMPDLENFVGRGFHSVIIENAAKAMSEIDYSGREKFYIISSLSERLNDAHVTALMDEEVLNAKLLFGHDKKCCDALPFQSAQKRSMAIAACVRNAFVRDGQDPKHQIPIAEYFMKNLDRLTNFLKGEAITYRDMVKKSIAVQKRLKEQTVDEEQQEEEEEEEERMVLSRPDVPRGITTSSSTNQRVGVLVAFHVTWYKWLRQKQPSDLVRARLWHLYALVRMHQLAKVSFNKVAASGRLFFPVLSDEEHHDDYWLRALSLPVSAGGDDTSPLLLPAYSSYLSTVSRTYIMSSLKRVDAVKHCYALMYGLSLFDMTVDVNELVDSRRVSSSAKPIGYNRELDLKEYFGSIFPCMVDEYFTHTPEDVIAAARSVEERVASLARRLRHASGGKNLRCSKKSVLLATRTLTSIARGNALMKLEKDNTLPEAKRPKRSLADRTTAAGTGAVTLTRGHAQKNAVSYLVDAAIIEGGPAAVKSIRSDTKFVVNNIDLSYLSAETPIRHIHRGRILEAIRSKKPFIDSVTDHRLLRNSENARKFTQVLTDLRNKVTRVRSVNLYQGQNVVFTNTNFQQIHGTEERFVTKDTGVIKDIVVKNGTAAVLVWVERLNATLRLTEGRHFLGANQNAYVRYIPLESSQAMTIFSCQGQTFSRDTVVDLTGVSPQDAYVAITRNDDPLNLYVLEGRESERKNLRNLKFSMGKDRANLLPLGGVGNLGGEAFGGDPTRDTVTAVQRFIMNRSGNAVAFNSAWMANTGKILQRDGGGLKAELDRIDEFFFGGPRKGEYAEYYTRVTHDKIMELFTAVVRSVTHYAVRTHVQIPSLITRDGVEIHPSFLNASPRKDTLSSLFFDVAPHSKSAAVLQVFLHYLFLVFERLHISNSSFAFLPSAAPVVNRHTRPDIPPGSDPICAIYIPGGLDYESEDFKESSGNEVSRTPMSNVDRLADNIEALRKSARDRAEAEKVTQYISKCMRHNLRRPGKFCRPHETCGLSRHGAIVAATRCEQSHVHENEKGWVSFSDEINLYGLLIFMTRLAAASGVTKLELQDEELEPREGQKGPVFAPLEATPPGYRLRLSEDILFSGQVAPMERVQFSLHACRVNQADAPANSKIFHSDFERKISGKKLNGANILAISEMLFGQHTTAGIRASLFHGVGKVLARKTIENKENVLRHVEEFILGELKRNRRQRLTFWVSLKAETDRTPAASSSSTARREMFVNRDKTGAVQKKH